MANRPTYTKLKSVETEDYRYEVLQGDATGRLYLVSYYKDDFDDDGGVDVEEMPEIEAIRLVGLLFNVHITDDNGVCHI